MSKSDRELLFWASLAALGLLISRTGDPWNLSAMGLAVVSLLMLGYAVFKRRRGRGTDDLG
jgi:hypothetical protein